MSDEQIAEEVLYQENASNHNLSEEEKQMESGKELVITHKDALVAINTLIQYVEKDAEIGNKSSEFYNSVRSLIELKALSELKQISLDSQYINFFIYSSTLSYIEHCVLHELKNLLTF